MPQDTSPRSTPVLSVEGLHFSYPHRHVFSAWSHRFGPGLTWLKGNNGSGKSTLLKLLAGALPPWRGRIALDDIEQQAHALAYRREVFWCGPGPIALDHLTPIEYWGFMRQLYPRLDETQLRQHMTAFGLAPHLDAPLRSLSTGTQRKVWVAASLSAGTRVTLIDEPFNALDAASLAHLREALASCAQQTHRIWILTSHEDLGPASAWARVLNLDAPVPPVFAQSSLPPEPCSTPPAPSPAQSD
jgi:ABC-type multidrug transport system ATPase subunit